MPARAAAQVAAGKGERCKTHLQTPNSQIGASPRGSARARMTGTDEGGSMSGFRQRTGRPLSRMAVKALPAALQSALATTAWPRAKPPVSAWDSLKQKLSPSGDSSAGT